jgi:signal transduction histidine kinase/CheY-like chemotaxis protein
MEKNKNLIYIGLYSLLGLIGLAFCLFVLLYASQQRLVTLGEIRHDSDELASKLHQSSNDLTRLVRTYAITGNKMYEQQFWDVLAIRDGEKPRPLHYNRVYWDFLAVENGEPPYPLGKLIPLKELMKEAGFTDREFSLLAEAQKNSDQLVELEQIAMNAMKGKARSESGEITNDTSGQQVAIKILFGEKYHQAKIKIMRPINIFLEELDNRTRTEFTSQAFLLHVLLISLISAFILIICIVVFVMRQSKQYHASMVNALRVRTIELKESNKGLSIEIDERKKMAKTVLQLEKLKALGTITAGVAHEFNNILAIISGKIQLMELDHRDDKELIDQIGVIHRAVKDGSNISDRMLTFTKTEKDVTAYTSNDIRSIINQSITFAMPRWKNEAQARGIDYKMNIDGMKKVPSILCNPTEIREIFINIINNALDAMPEGGSLLFSTWSADETVFASISDTGNGMSEDVKKRIFDPFFTTKLPLGTGLGMSTVYGIVTRHSGKIEVESELGKGTTFTIQLPTTIKTVNLIEATDQEQKIKSKDLRILVVDDDEDICDILDKSLSRSGHTVKTVDNGEEALGLIKSEKYDLVLTDMAMPDVSGHKIIKSLNEKEKRPKIGLITGWGKDLKCLDEEGMKVDFIIKKPFKLPELIKHINDLFSADSK